MSRFNSEIYEKLYPRNEPVVREEVETAVESFNPTAEIENTSVENEGSEVIEGAGVSDTDSE